MSNRRFGGRVGGVGRNLDVRPIVAVLTGSGFKAVREGLMSARGDYQDGYGEPLSLSVGGRGTELLRGTSGVGPITLFGGGSLVQIVCEVKGSIGALR
jgi:hypothetical protein